ncbi:MAG: polyhydroxyalkanoate synthesis repressor PhaR [Chromatiales bacterium]|nr:polyhydroxyalkanoate synthesis repressor PhaR [Chromatiales bacterium]
MAEPHLIKKYPNRRLYDTMQSRYVTLHEVRDLVRSGVDIRVIDSETNEEITRAVLLQIILEQESGGEPLFTADALARMIRVYGDSVQQLFGGFFERSMELFSEQQSQVSRALSGTPMGAMSDLAMRNMELWQDLQRQWLNAAGVGDSGTKKDSGKP